MPKKPQFNVRIPKTFVILIIILIAVVLQLVATTFGWIKYEFLYLWAVWLILNNAIIVLVLIGAVFVGIYMGHKILSIGGFTPFEKAMLQMKEDIKKINERLDSIEMMLERPRK